MVALKRALIASAAAFAAVFALLAGQLWLGNDPALGESGGQQAAEEQELHASVVDTVLGVATSLLDEEHDEDEGRGAAMRSGTS